MIVVRVELWSAITGKRSTLAEMTIANDGTGTYRHGNYTGSALRKGTIRAQRTGRVENHSRKCQHVWVLVRKMLQAMKY